MRDFTGKRYWLVGASEGLGRALAHRLSAAGAHVIVSARSAERLDDLVQSLPGPANAVSCDVSDRESIAKAVSEIEEIDGVVYLAGVYWPQSAKDWVTDEVEAMCDINFTGCARVIGAVIGPMVKRNAGHIVITGSLSGFRGLPGATGYGASKAGTMWLAEGLYADLHKTGVHVQLANPGFIKTRLTDKNDFTMPFLMTPEEAADHMFDLMRSRRFKKNFPRLFSWLFRGSQFLPDWLYYPIFARKS